MSGDSRPRCPRCGEPARYATRMARVRFVVQPDGELTDALRIVPTGDQEGETTYECGGHHRWEAGV